MTTYTKAVTLDWNEWILIPEYQSARDDVILAMINAGKTDGIREFLGGFAIRRLFIDQAAAEEWKNWVTSNAPPGYLISAEITDAPPE